MNPGRWSRKWLLWLALLLPLAQAMAGTHALSHAMGDRPGEGLVHLAHCDLCLTAADLGTGAPTAEPAAWLSGPAVPAAPLPALGGIAGTVNAGLPPVRAPPASA